MNNFLKCFVFLAIIFIANSSKARELSIVTTIKPLYFLVKSVTYGIQKPILLIDENESPHTYRLKPSDLRKIYRADIAFLVSRNLEQRLFKAFNKNTNSSKLVEMSNQRGIKLLKFDNDNQDKHENEYGYDPHIWLSPDNAIRMLNVIADKLSEIDKENADFYYRNAQTTKLQIVRLIRRNKEKFLQKQDLSYLLFHDTYNYYEDFFNIKSLGLINIGHENTLSARKVSEIRRTIRDKKVKCIVTEPKFSSLNFDNFIVNNKVKVIELDPLGVNLLKEDSYIDLINNLTDKMLEC